MSDEPTSDPAGDIRYHVSFDTSMSAVPTPVLLRVADDIDAKDARIKELEASEDFWATSWSDEHTALVLARKRITELASELEEVTRIVMEEAENHRYGSPRYDITLDHLHAIAESCREALTPSEILRRLLGEDTDR